MLMDLPADRVDEIRAAIESGTYETEERLDIAVDQLLDEIIEDDPKQWAETMEEITKIDIEIEACENAIAGAFSVVEANELASRVADLTERRHLLEQTLG